MCRRRDDDVIEELTEDSFDGVDIALFSAGGSISKKFGPLAAAKGCFVVDNSSAFRMDPDVPLVIPEVNPEEAMAEYKLGGARKGGIIANPNCSTIIALMAVTPIHRAVGVKRMIASTYQAASGAGALAMAELEQQTRDVLNGDPVTMDIFSWQYAFNLFSHFATMTENGYNEEEMKMVMETRKIWGAQDVQIAATCIRVPVMRAHAESINLELDGELSEEEARAILEKAPGVSLSTTAPTTSSPRPWTPRTWTTCTSGASGTTSRRGATTASSSSSAATRSRRAPRSTPCRWPSCSCRRRAAPKREARRNRRRRDESASRVRI